MFYTFRKSKGATSRGASPATHDHAPRPRSQDHTSQFAKNVIIPTCDLSSEDTLKSALMDYAKNLIRQESFDDLWHMFDYVAKDGTCSEAGHLLLHSAYMGARTDFMNGAELFAKRSSDLSKFSGFDTLAALYTDHKNTPFAASLALMCLNGMEQLFKSNIETPNLPMQAVTLRTSLEQALIEQMDALIYLVPQCDDAMNEGHADHAIKYTRRILTQAPLCTNVTRRLGRALGRDMRRTGQSDLLDLSARQCAANTYDSCGYAQYAWAYLDALVQRPEVIQELGVKFFADAVEDILEHFPSQEPVNRLLANVTLVLHHAPRTVEIPTAHRTALRAICERLTTDALQELHPLIWAEANTLVSPQEHRPNIEHLLSFGYDRATAHLVSHFQHSLHEGKSVVFTGSGIDLIAKTHPS